MNLFLFGGKCRFWEREPARWQNKAEFIFSLLADDEIFFIFGGKCCPVKHRTARCAENKKDRVKDALIFTFYDSQRAYPLLKRKSP